jgi:hypothetical protein
MRLYLASGNPNKAAELQAMADALAGGAAGPGGRSRSCPRRRPAGCPPSPRTRARFPGTPARRRVRAPGRCCPRAAGRSPTTAGCASRRWAGPRRRVAYYAGRGRPGGNLAKLVAPCAACPRAGAAPSSSASCSWRPRGGSSASFEGRCRAACRDEPRGRGGFGYDPLFVPEGLRAHPGRDAPPG